jgi:hypothetical protein
MKNGGALFSFQQTDYFLREGGIRMHLDAVPWIIFGVGLTLGISPPFKTTLAQYVPTLPRGMAYFSVIWFVL